MRFVFDDFALDTDPAELSRSGSRIAVEPRALDLLGFLVENRHRELTAQDIAKGIAQGRFVSDAEIARCLDTLRGVLGDVDEDRQFIRTLADNRIRFIAEVQESAVDSKVEKPVPGRVEPAQAPQSETQHHGRPSIVVLPFDSMIPSGLERVLCEALPHELIQALSRLRWIKVIARGTAFRFRAPVPDLAIISRQLSVRYALCGTVERLGEIVAITVELSDCEAGSVIWADRFEVRPEALQEVRHEIVARVISSLEIYIPENEAQHAQFKASNDLDAWANYHLGLRHMFRFSQEDNDVATKLFERAIAQDPTFARAHAGLSFTRFQDAFLKYTPDIPTAIADARRYAELSMELDPLDPFSNLTMGRSFWLEGDPVAGLSWLERSISLSPNFAQAHYSKSFAQAIQGDAAEAIENATKAFDLSPLDPLLYAIYSVRALGMMRTAAMDQAVAEAERAARAPGAHYLVMMIAAMICAIAGNEAEARYWTAEVRSRRPDASKEQFFAAFPFIDEEFRREVTEGLARAGF